jgi:ADP-ribose pyrophosphatase YjhB (NUDIX family)
MESNKKVNPNFHPEDQNKLEITEEIELQNEDLEDKFISIVLIIRKENNLPNYVVSQRTNIRKSMYQYFQCPGGHCKENEKFEEAAKRELFEETGLKIDKTRWKHFETKTWTHKREHLPKTRHCSIYEIEITEEEFFYIEQKEPENNGPWIITSLTGLILEDCIDSLKSHIAYEIENYTRNWQKYVVEGPIGAGKSTIISMLPKEWKRIPEAALSETLAPKLQEFYEKKITPIEFQELIEMEYLLILMKLLETPYSQSIVFDRSQHATKIFSRYNKIPEEEIQRIKSNSCYYEALLRDAERIYIQVPKYIMCWNTYKRARPQENANTLKYNLGLREMYHEGYKDAYKECRKPTKYINNDTLFLFGKSSLKKQIKEAFNLE